MIPWVSGDPLVPGTVVPVAYRFPERRCLMLQCPPSSLKRNPLSIASHQRTPNSYDCRLRCCRFQNRRRCRVSRVLASFPPRSRCHSDRPPQSGHPQAPPLLAPIFFYVSILASVFMSRVPPSPSADGHWFSLQRQRTQSSLGKSENTQRFGDSAQPWPVQEEVRVGASHQKTRGICCKRRIYHPPIKISAIKSSVSLEAPSPVAPFPPSCHTAPQAENQASLAYHARKAARSLRRL